jgi:hypothetical protein
VEHRLLFPLDHVEEYLRQAVKSVHRDGSRLKWPSWEGEAELAVEGSNYFMALASDE